MLVADAPQGHHRTSQHQRGYDVPQRSREFRLRRQQQTHDPAILVGVLNIFFSKRTSLKGFFQESGRSSAYTAPVAEGHQELS